MRTRFAWLAAAPLLLVSGCPLDTASTAGSPGGAVIVGRLSFAGDSAKLLAAQGIDCPEVVVTLNGVGVTVVFDDDDCSFLVSDVEPAALLALRVDLPDLGVAGTAEIRNVADGEFIEVEILTGDDSLSLVIARRAEPGPPAALPDVITANNVTIQLEDGAIDHGLTVRGNNFTLVGIAGENCDAPGWSVITDSVQVDGNNATFRNIAFRGAVEVRGNNAKFINCCFDGRLVIFGNGLTVSGE